MLLLLAARLRAISAASHLRMFPSASLLSAHFFLLMLSSHLGMTRFHLGIASTHLSVPRHLRIHGMLAVSRASLLASHFAGVHFRLVSAHVCPVALISGLQLVSVCSDFSCSSVICSRAMPIMFSHISAVVFSFSRSGSRTRFLKVTVSYVPRFVSSFSSSRCCGAQA